MVVEVQIAVNGPGLFSDEDNPIGIAEAVEGPRPESWRDKIEVIAPALAFMNDPQAGQLRLMGGVHRVKTVQRIGADNVDGLFGQLDANFAQRFQIAGQFGVSAQGMGPDLHLDPPLFIRPA